MFPLLTRATKVTMRASSTVNAKPTTPGHTGCLVPRFANTGIPKITDDAMKITRQMSRASFALMRHGRSDSIGAPGCDLRAEGRQRARYEKTWSGQNFRESAPVIGD